MAENTTPNDPGRVANARTVFVISDIHLGGAYPTVDHPRGFRMCTKPGALASFIASLPARGNGKPVELVINGDFIDFLAEEYGGAFRDFAGIDAVDVIGRLADTEQRPEEAQVFAKLGQLLLKGHSLTILVGNHDVELSIPEVRARLTDALGGPRDTLRFIDDEAYVIGDAHIEHGNRYDGFNAMALTGLEALRAGELDKFTSPPGSRLVATVMNPLKKEYPFIDLLKPETGAAIPVLLALDPNQRNLLGRVAKLKYEADRRQALIACGEPIPVAASTSTTDDTSEELTADEALSQMLLEVLDRDEELCKSLESPEVSELAPIDIASLTAEEGYNLAKLLLGGTGRIATLRRVLTVLNRDFSFQTGVEEDERFLSGSRNVDTAIRFAIFGHTHLAKDVIESGRPRYLNSGTWTDLVPFPERILEIGPNETEKNVEQRLEQFLKDMRAGELDKWIVFKPTFIRFDFDGVRASNVELASFKWDGKTVS